MNTSLQAPCDLHCHSKYSDGSCTPAELIAMAEGLGLCALALCDHNTVAGLPDFLRAGQHSPVAAVAGVEVTCAYEGDEIHMLGLFIRPDKYDRLNQRLERIQLEKDRSNFEFYKRLQAAGYDISYRRIAESGERGSINRVHFAKELVRCGYASDVDAAFRDVLAERLGIYIPPPRQDALEVVQFLAEADALPVMAHPFLNLQGEKLHTFLGLAKERGLVGMECVYSTFDEAQTQAAHALCAELGLLPSGGSDYHGENKPTISMGIGRGGLCVPGKYYAALAERAAAL